MTLDMRLILLKHSEPEFINAVVRFRVEFPEDPKTYTYAAVKAGGKWFATGHKSIGRTWPDLLDVLTRNGASITSAEVANGFEDLAE